MNRKEKRNFDKRLVLWKEKIETRNTIIMIMAAVIFALLVVIALREEKAEIKPTERIVYTIGQKSPQTTCIEPKEDKLDELYTFVELSETGIRNKMLEEFTEYDIDIMARVVMSESSIEPYECKMLVAKTLLNRYYSDNFKGSIYELADKGFSMQDNGEVTEECYSAVYDAFTSDDPVFYFRTDYYHSFGQPYKQVGITCFSTE